MFAEKGLRNRVAKYRFCGIRCVIHQNFMVLIGLSFLTTEISNLVIAEPLFAKGRRINPQREYAFGRSYMVDSSIDEILGGNAIFKVNEPGIGTVQNNCRRGVSLPVKDTVLK